MTPRHDSHMKKKAVYATITWKVTCASNGRYWLSTVSRSFVIKLRHIVSRMKENENDMPAAPPRDRLTK